MPASGAGVPPLWGGAHPDEDGSTGTVGDTDEVAILPPVSGG